MCLSLQYHSLDNGSGIECDSSPEVNFHVKEKVCDDKHVLLIFSWVYYILINLNIDFQEPILLTYLYCTSQAVVESSETTSQPTLPAVPVPCGGFKYRLPLPEILKNLKEKHSSPAVHVMVSF